jgi:hypothetical protein
MICSITQVELLPTHVHDVEENLSSDSRLEALQKIQRFMDGFKPSETVQK